MINQCLCKRLIQSGIDKKNRILVHSLTILFLIVNNSVIGIMNCDRKVKDENK